MRMEQRLVQPGTRPSLGVTLSPSLAVILSAAKNLDPVLRINSAKGLVSKMRCFAPLSLTHAVGISAVLH